MYTQNIQQHRHTYTHTYEVYEVQPVHIPTGRVFVSFLVRSCPQERIAGSRLGNTVKKHINNNKKHDEMILVHFILAATIWHYQLVYMQFAVRDVTFCLPHIGCIKLIIPSKVAQKGS